MGSLEQLPKNEVQVRVLLSAPGEITETDIDLAAASGSVIIGFNTSLASGAKRAADANEVLNPIMTEPDAAARSISVSVISPGAESRTLT